MGRKATWIQKLWMLGAHWGFQEEPWCFDEMSMAPDIFDLDAIYDRLEGELQQMQEAKEKDPSPLTGFIRADPDFKSPPPYRDSTALSQGSSRDEERRAMGLASRLGRKKRNGLKKASAI